MHTRFARTAALIAAAAAVISPVVNAPAASAEPALAAPGGPMRMFPANPPATLTDVTGKTINVPRSNFVYPCSQGPTGMLRTANGEQRVMLTVSHCVNAVPGMQPLAKEVYATRNGEYVKIGEAGAHTQMLPGAHDFSNPHSAVWTNDWGVVHIDNGVVDTKLTQSQDVRGGAKGEPVALTTVRDFRTLAPGEFSIDNFGQPICKDGRTTGRTCGTQLARTRDGVYSYGLDYTPGDSGGVNYDPRDGAILGVSSITLKAFGHSLGKAQPVDRIIEDVTGAPDGYVNEYFTVTQSTAAPEDFVPNAVEFAKNDEEFFAANPGYELPNPRAELDKATAAAQQDAVRLGEQALRGQVNPAEAKELLQQHASEIAYWGGNTLAFELGKLL